MKDFEVKKDDVAVANNKATIRSKSFGDSLADDRGAVADYLSGQVAPIDPTEISVDATGRIVISNPEFARRLSEKLKEPDVLGGNVICPSPNIVC